VNVNAIFYRWGRRSSTDELIRREREREQNGARSFSSGIVDAWCFKPKRFGISTRSAALVSESPPSAVSAQRLLLSLHLFLALELVSEALISARR
jgi:hypothetical protein